MSGKMSCLQSGQLLLQSLKEPSCQVRPVLSDRKFWQITNSIATGQSIHETITFQYLLITYITYSCKTATYSLKIVSTQVLKNTFIWLPFRIGLIFLCLYYSFQ